MTSTTCPGRGPSPSPDFVICHRSGADHLLRPVAKAMLPKPPKAERADDKLTGGKGRAKAGRLEVKAKQGKGKRGEVLAVVAG